MPPNSGMALSVRTVRPRNTAEHMNAGMPGWRRSRSSDAPVQTERRSLSPEMERAFRANQRVRVLGHLPPHSVPTIYAPVRWGTHLFPHLSGAMTLDIQASPDHPSPTLRLPNSKTFEIRLPDHGAPKERWKERWNVSEPRSLAPKIDVVPQNFLRAPLRWFNQFPIKMAGKLRPTEKGEPPIRAFSDEDNVALLLHLRDLLRQVTVEETLKEEAHNRIAATIARRNRLVLYGFVDPTVSAIGLLAAA